MTERRFLLPPGLDQAARDAELEELSRRHCRGGRMVTAWLEDRYPGERGWKYQPDNTNEKQRVYYAIMVSRPAEPGERP
jgi:hypothetical protein